MNDIVLKPLPHFRDAHVLHINMPDKEIVADVLFSSGIPVAAIVYRALNEPGEPLNIEQRGLISFNVPVYPNNNITRRHVQAFIGERRATYLTRDEGGVLEGIMAGKMPDKVYNEHTHEERRRLDARAREAARKAQEVYDPRELSTGWRY
jgi:hypothetical protein